MTSRDCLPSEDFVDSLADAYEHLHDLVHLGVHPLVKQLLPQGTDTPRAGRRLHELLRGFIDELDPGPLAPPFSHEWRRHRYLVLRYIRGQSHQSIANTFQVGLRQYYRIRRGLLEELARLVWQHSPRQAESTETTPWHSQQQEASRLELLRLESSRIAQADHFARVPELVESIILLTSEMLQRRNISLTADMAPSLSPVHVPVGLLRQIMLALISVFTEGAADMRLVLSVRENDSAVVLRIEAHPLDAAKAPGARVSDRLAELDELAMQGNCHILPVYEGERMRALELQMPLAHSTVLCVDDNEDMLALMRGYLTPAGYRVIVAHNGEEGLALAQARSPFAITLDLMMPSHDGWELLQTLTSHPETCDIPIIICSVLKQQELALALGAATYLEKPVTQQGLLKALADLQST